MDLQKISKFLNDNKSIKIEIKVIDDKNNIVNGQMTVDQLLELDNIGIHGLYKLFNVCCEKLMDKGNFGTVDLSLKNDAGLEIICGESYYYYFKPWSNKNDKINTKVKILDIDHINELVKTDLDRNWLDINNLYDKKQK